MTITDRELGEWEARNGLGTDNDGRREAMGRLIAEIRARKRYHENDVENLLAKIAGQAKEIERLKNLLSETDQRRENAIARIALVGIGKP